MKMKNLFIFAILSYLQSVMFVTCDESDAMHIRSLQSSIFYRVVNYLTEKTQRVSAEVRYLQMAYEFYYMHLHFTFNSAEKMISTVSTSDDNVESNVTGANMVMLMKKLDDIYAPALISHTVNFFRECSAAVVEKKVYMTYISIMRYADNEEINYELIETTTEKFLRHTPKYSNLLLWEKRSNSDKLTNSLKYQRMACGNTTELNGMCDWRRLGLSANDAGNQCLYRFLNIQYYQSSPY
ncbi:hypothetical protein KSF78_0001528 [Schistosoma japonicum]|nr:hypothetical protein KSF78_0001528 [Schistosoma japonicum]